MPKIAYIDKNFQDTAQRIIVKANSIIEDYENQGFDLTLRQLYYQFVTKNWLPEIWADKKTGSTNNEASYKKLGSIISDARLAREQKGKGKLEEIAYSCEDEDV